MANITLSGQLGPWVISGVALAQVWVIALVKRLKRATVEVYESGNIEVGYSTLGPTLGLMGTLRAMNRDVFVKRISISVTKMKDSSLHRFSWFAFRSNLLSLKPTEAPVLEVASSFLLRRDDPFKYNILFAEESFSAQMTSKVAAVAPDWMKFQTDRDNALRQEQHGNETSTANIQPVSIQSLYDEFFKNSATLTDAYTALDRACYWEAGIYRVSISVEGARPDKVFTKQYEFALSEGDAESLRLNTISILRALCGFQEVFRFAYPQYQTK